jgi:Sigma-70, region 4
MASKQEDDFEKRVAEALGAQRSFPVEGLPSQGPLDLLQLGGELGRCLRSSGGRPTDPELAIDDLPPATAERLRGINRLLGAIFRGRSPKLSDLLKDQGFTSTEIGALKTRLLDRYLDELTRIWIGFFEEILPANRALVLRLRYGLDGESPPTLQAIGEELGLSRERIRQLQMSAVNRLRGRKRWDRLRTMVGDATRTVLSAV